MKKYIFLIAAFAAVLITQKIFSETANWSQLTLHGGVYAGAVKAGKYLYYGTNYSKLYIQNITKTEDVMAIELNSGSVVPQQVLNGSVYVISRDTLYKISRKSGKIIWRFVSDGNYDLDRSEIKKGVVYLTARDGTLYALNINTGEVKWKMTAFAAKNLNAKLLNNSLYLAPDFWIYKGFVYLEDRNGRLSKINKNNGKLIWQREFDEVLVGNISINKNKIVIFTSGGLGMALDIRNGKTLWEKKNTGRIICASTYKSGLTNKDKDLIAVNDKGVILKIDMANGQDKWTSDEFGPGLNCPQRFTREGVFTNTSGDLIKIDMLNGKTVKKEIGFGKISLPAQINYNYFGSPRYLLAGLDGKVIMADAEMQTKWSFETGYPIYSPPLIFGEYVYVATTNGAVFKINKNTGKAGKGLLKSKSKLELTKFKVHKNEIFEFTLNSENKFRNPWTEGLLSGIFKSESGREIKIDGFYYDANAWKLRFNPTEKGKWKYKIAWIDHGEIFDFQGEIFAETDTSDSFLKISPVNKKRLTLDGKSIFNGVGIQESILDLNYDGTPLNDWSTGASDFVAATSSSGVKTYFKSDKVISFKDYLNAYGPGAAGINIYRYSIMNGNNPLYRNLETPTVFSIQEGKVADELLKGLRDNGMHVWMTFFNFDVPFKNSLTETEKKQLETYLRYLIARFGVYTDIWELVNECTLPGPLKEHLISVIKKYDFENRPISTSFEDPENPGIDIISPHWYETESLEVSDIKTAQLIDAYKNFKKPVIFGEQGNAKFNWDDSSAARMRVRLWTGFFKEGILIFWNDSTKKGLKQELPFYANIYIGEEERKFIKNLQSFSSGFPLDATPGIIQTGRENVRGYSLTNSGGVLGGYLFNASVLTAENIVVSISVKKNSEIIWYSPETGNGIKKDNCASLCVLYAPAFRRDLAFKVKEK